MRSVGAWQGILRYLTVDALLLPNQSHAMTAFSILCVTDCFIDRVNKANEDIGKPRPYLLGLALDEQIVEAVPLETHDM